MLEEPTPQAPTQRDTTVLLVSFNSAHLLDERLCEYAEHPTIVVDNASSDGTRALLASKYPHVRCIESEVNSGYGRAANRGFEEIDSRFALLVNPDAKLKADAFAQFEQEARALGEGWLFIAPNTGIPPESPERETGSLERITAASGAALLFDVRAFRRLGGFDPNIFLFFEETDLCRRAMNEGIAMYFAREIIVDHELGTSTHRTLAREYMRKWHYNWSSLYFSRKHRLWARFARTLWKNLVVAGFKLRRLEAVPPRDRDELRYALCHARHHSARAFVRGAPAFLPSGEPFRDPIVDVFEGRS
jgi:GT2 family glycosyltransferase